MNNETICMLPFVSLAIRPGGNVKPCCRYKMKEKYNIKYQSIDTIFNNTFFNNLRTSMLKNEQNNGCIRCYNEEYANILSMRINSLNDFDKKYIDKPDIYFLEISPSIKCNLSCRTCSGLLSSSWRLKEKKLIDKKEYFDRPKLSNIENVDYFIDLNKYNNLRLIKIVGGEPLLAPNLLKILTSIPRARRAEIDLSFYTNCTIFPKKELLKVLKSFRSLEIKLSIDAFGKENDHIRVGSSWNEVEINVQKWYSLQNKTIKIFIATTVSAYNIFKLKHLIDWKNKRFPNIIHFFQILNAPSYLSLLIYSEDKLNKVIEELSNYIHKSEHIYEVIQYIKQSKTRSREFNKFIEFNKRIDE